MAGDGGLVVLVGDSIGGQAGGLGERRSRQPVQACCCADVYRAALRWSKHSDMAVAMTDPKTDRQTGTLEF